MGIEERRRRSQSRRGRRSGGSGAGGGVGGRTESLAREREMSIGEGTESMGARYRSPGRVTRMGSDTSNSSNSTTAGASATSSSDVNQLETPSATTPLPLPRHRRTTSRVRASSSSGLRSSSTTTERAPSSRQVSHQHAQAHSNLSHPITHPYPSPGQPVEPFILVHLSDPLALAAVRSAFSIAPSPPPPFQFASAPPSTSNLTSSPTTITSSARRAAVDIPSPTEGLSEEEEDERPRGRSSGRISDNSYSSHGTHSGSSTHVGGKGMRAHASSRSKQAALRETEENRDRDQTPRGATSGPTSTAGGVKSRSPPSPPSDAEDDLPLSPAPAQGRPLFGFPMFEAGGFFDDLTSGSKAERTRPGYQRSLSTTGRLTLDR